MPLKDHYGKWTQQIVGHTFFKGYGYSLGNNHSDWTFISGNASIYDGLIWQMGHCNSIMINK